MCVSVLAAAAAWPAIVAVVPNWKGCADNISQALPYCDTKLSHEQRLLALVSNLTLQEKIGMISPDPALGDPCMDHTSGKPSIGLPNYVWLIEVNSDVQTNCMGADRCATNFIGPMGMGSSFNRSSWRLKGDVLATEFRAFNNAGNNLVGLTGFGPNINIARDPRFGRTSELPGEDPFHSGTYGTEVTLLLFRRQECEQRLAGLLSAPRRPAHDFTRRLPPFLQNTAGLNTGFIYRRNSE